MQVQLKSTHGYGKKEGVKFLVYSPAGYGKTTLCATAPTPVILSAESGLLSLRKYNLPYIEINTINDLRTAYAWAKGSKEARQFQTICIDSISEIAETVLAFQKTKSKDGRMAYGDMIDEMNKVIKEFRDLQGYNIYMSAKQARIKNEATGVIMNVPSMPGEKLGQNLPYLPDEVFQLDIEGVGANSFRFLRCQPDFMNTAKDRSGALTAMEEPHLGKIIEKIHLAA